MGKPTICKGENKGADQLRGNREADQRLCNRYSDSTIPPLLNSKISNFKLFSVFVQAGLCRTCSETTLLVFPRGGSYIYIFTAITLNDVLHFPMKNIKSRDGEATPMGGATSKPTSDVFFFILVGVTSVAYRHDFKSENLTFWLFQNYVKSDLISNNMKMSDDRCN